MPGENRKPQRPPELSGQNDAVRAYRGFGEVIFNTSLTPS